ncbi:hypothetical protein MM1S1540310_3979 [Mycobacteroides abscessus subsp. bolletii 1S-154-0310]|uniref:Uncharacterized protein n=1 Tax=Mycobacteroides saopaulense TaxID=1578165 RepID=A0A1X0IUF0_9MYCO|nr:MULTISPECIES: hypothetical protein [Mycobacteroides]EIU64077.1 hypothetical protein MM1S1510930_4423 [Mycobacteroides abscessus subsp. bolletii 1S-151-0930]EIU70792.1 hypothetical protein MM1S1520914_4631 [Mycobacteroides abscessus subsp. bolletii 1S-152-0914]EIU71175.1 hypothetical protein MM1S1530915_3975 [Mycobacteroides abscessus subsp. bolletii 1S-153-0915]EIU80861.1 hypothetical protein MM1S1540310_3979 [Mycobacteroides abscessus subsp. bolletii 1S-154-0310]MBE5480755.1 hypothetical p
MSGYTFQLRDMDPQAREKAAGAAKKTLHMKDGAGAELAAPMLKARDIIDTQLQAMLTRGDLTFGALPTGDEVKKQYDDRANQAKTGLAGLRDQYQAFADHFIATELYFKKSDEEIAKMFDAGYAGTVISY